MDVGRAGSAEASRFPNADSKSETRYVRLGKVFLKGPPLRCVHGLLNEVCPPSPEPVPIASGHEAPSGIAQSVTASPKQTPVASPSRIFTSASSRIGGSALGFLATFLVTRALGPAQSGILFATITWALGLAILARWGASERILIQLSPLKGGWRQGAIAGFVNREIRGSLIRIAILLGAVLAGLWIMDQPPALDVPLLVTLAPATAILQLVSAACKSMQRLTTALIFEIILQPVVVIATVMMVMEARAFDPFTTIAFSYLLATIAATAGCVVIGMRGQWHARILKMDRVAGPQRARDFGLIETSNFVATALPMLVLPFLLPPADVGILNLTFRIVASISLLASTVHLLTLPALSIALHGKDENAWRHIVRRGRLMLVGVAGLFLLAVLTAGPSVLRLAGEGFLEGARSLEIMSILFAAGTALGPSAAVISVLGAQHLLRNVTVGTTVLSLVLFVPVVEQWGLEGAAFLTGGSFLVTRLALLVLELRETRRVNWSRTAR